VLVPMLLVALAAVTTLLVGHAADERARAGRRLFAQAWQLRRFVLDSTDEPEPRR
jgi:hypothetical protein